MDYNTLLQAHGIDINDCCKFESFFDETETIIFIKLKPNQRKCVFCGFKDSSIKEYKNEGIVYVDDNFDESFPRRISVTNSDHEINYIMLRTNDVFISTMRDYYSLGIVRFKNLMCQECFLQLVAIRL